MEKWKDIPNYYGYQASTNGRIRTHNKITHTEKHGKRIWKDRVLKYKGNGLPMGYRVDLWKNGKPHTFLVSRLIATTFLEDFIDTKLTVNHKDGNRLNNNLENLEWLTRGENIKHAFENNLCTSQTNCVLEDKNKRLYKFNSLSKASEFLGRNEGYISLCIKKNRKVKGINNEKYTIYTKVS